MRTLIAACLLVNATSAIAHPALDAIAAAGKNPLSELPHRMVETAVANGATKKTIASYDPSAPAGLRWTLDSIDGSAASGVELAEFRKKKISKAPTTLSELVDVASLTPLERTPNPRRWSFRFKEGKKINGMGLDKFGVVVALGDGDQCACAPCPRPARCAGSAPASATASRCSRSTPCCFSSRTPSTRAW